MPFGNPQAEVSRSSPLNYTQGQSHHPLNHSNSPNTGPGHHTVPSSSSPSVVSQRTSPHTTHPSHQHVTVLVNPTRTKPADNAQPPAHPMIQHHQTTIVGIRRNSPPAGNAPGQVSYFGRDELASNESGVGGSHISSVMLQAMGAQSQAASLQHLQNSPNMRSNNHMSPNSSSSPSSNNMHHQHPNGAPHHSNGNHSLLTAASVAHGQLQIPLHMLQQQHQQRIKQERSPTNHGHQVHMQSNNIAMSPTQHKPMQSPSPSQLNSMAMINPSMQMRHPMRDAAILLRVKNEFPNLTQVQQRMAWNSNSRINGVKPEIIGGPLPNNMRQNGSNVASPPQSSSQTPPRATPTVIMGESCGVRTMVWGFEPSSNPMPSSPATSSSNQSSTSTSQNEEAAQLLLSLGQGGSRPNDGRARAPVQRSPHPLNMERLWAGDYSQLPAGQQLHALNLSQPQWMGGGPPGHKVRLSNKSLSTQRIRI